MAFRAVLPTEGVDNATYRTFPPVTCECQGTLGVPYNCPRSMHC